MAGTRVGYGENIMNLFSEHTTILMASTMLSAAVRNSSVLNDNHRV